MPTPKDQSRKRKGEISDSASHADDADGVDGVCAVVMLKMLLMARVLLTSPRMLGKRSDGSKPGML